MDILVLHRLPQRLALHASRIARRVPLGVAVLIAALGVAGRASAQPPGPPSAPRAAPLTDVTPARFAALRWLEGDWRGRASGGAWFYERYRAVDDSTVQMTSFPDSTFARGTEGDRIVLRGGAVRYENVVATRLDSAGVAFAAPSGRFGFTWDRAAAGWTATLWQVDAAGTRRTTFYYMEPRLARAPR